MLVLGVKTFKLNTHLTPVFFETIYTYPGICGTNDKEERYSFLFREVSLNKINYLRINLGSYGLSKILSIRLTHLNGLNPKVFPNPVYGDSKILFRNKNKEVATLTVYNALVNHVGRLIQTTQDSILISTLNIHEPGLYFFTIHISGITTRGKFLFL